MDILYLDSLYGLVIEHGDEGANIFHLYSLLNREQ